MTAPIRAQKEAIQLMQKGDQALAAGGKPARAAPQLEAALRLPPDDYTALLLLAKCRLAQDRAGEARRLAESARAGLLSGRSPGLAHRRPGLPGRPPLRRCLEQFQPL